jgi:hypothetical protein
MQKEQSLMMAMRYQLSMLGYPETVIDMQDPAISNFCKLLIQSAELEVKRNDPNKLSQPNSMYEYYMYINNPDAWDSSAYDSVSAEQAEWAKSYRESDYGFLFDTFESDSDWYKAVQHRDIDTLNLIYNEVVTYCKHKKVPYDVYLFVKNTPELLAKKNWADLEYTGIVDAYCDDDQDEYVNGFTGE